MAESVNLSTTPWILCCFSKLNSDEWNNSLALRVYATSFRTYLNNTFVELVGEGDEAKAGYRTEKRQKEKYNNCNKRQGLSVGTWNGTKCSWAL